MVLLFNVQQQSMSLNQIKHKHCETENGKLHTTNKQTNPQQVCERALAHYQLINYSTAFHLRPVDVLFKFPLIAKNRRKVAWEIRRR